MSEIEPPTRSTATVTVLFADLVGSTERQTRLGDDAADTFRQSFFASLAEAIGEAGEPVKNTGDGVMVVFRHSAVDAVVCAGRMHDGMASLRADPPAEIRVGIAAGEVANEDDDWFGTPVVEAARLCAAASNGQTLVSDVVRALVGSRGALRFRSVGALSLKGLPAPVPASVLEQGPPTPSSPRPRTHRRFRRAAAAVALLALVATATAVVLTRGSSPSPSSPSSRSGVPAAVGYTPTYASRRCPDDVRQAVPEASCGTLVVPEDRADPDNGHQVRLLVTRAPARGEETSDPVVDFGGDTLASSPVREHAEEIQLSTRGFAPSEPALTCPEYAEVAPAALARPTSDATTVREGRAALAACHDRWTAGGIDLDRYTYEDNGQDVLDLLRALDLERVHLVSGYVATIGALLVVREAPDAIRSLTLQTPVAPGTSGASDPTAFLAGAFDRYAALCREDDGCRALGDLRAHYVETYESYRASPALTTGTDADGRTHPVLLDGDRLAQVIADGLFDAEVHTLLAAGIVEPRGELLDTLSADRVLAYNQPSLLPDFAWGALLGARCSYDLHTVQSGRELSAQALPAFSGVDDGTLEWRCGSWPVEPLPDRAFDDGLAVDVPTLIIAGGITPMASVEWPSRLTSRTFTHATVVAFGSLAGSVMTRDEPPCLVEMRQGFIADPAEPIDVAGCEAMSPPIEFVAG